jgi:hypothetical protein
MSGCPFSGLFLMHNMDEVFQRGTQNVYPINGFNQDSGKRLVIVDARVFDSDGQFYHTHLGGG